MLHNETTVVSCFFEFQKKINIGKQKNEKMENTKHSHHDTDLHKLIYCQYMHVSMNLKYQLIHLQKVGTLGKNHTSYGSNKLH